MARTSKHSGWNRSPSRSLVAALLVVAVAAVVVAAWYSARQRPSQGGESSQFTLGSSQPAVAQPGGFYGEDATAASTADTALRAYDVHPDDLAKTMAALREAYRTNANVHISADQRTSRILVNAPANIQAQIAQRLNQAWPADRSAPRHVIELSHIGWRQIENALREIWGPNLTVDSPQGGGRSRVELTLAPGQSVTIAMDHQTRRVEVQGTAEAATAWSQLIRKLDKPARAADQRTHVVALRNARRDQVQMALTAFQPPVAAQDPVAQPPAADNGAAANQPEANQPAANQPNQPNGAVQNPDAAPPDAAAGQDAPIGDVQVEFLEGLDIIIIRGNPRDVDRVAKIIEDIERLSVESVPTIRVYQLANVNNEALAELITPLYGQVLQARQGRVSITPLGKPNALLLIGREESIEAVVALVQQLDRPVPPQSQLQVFQLRHVAAGTVQTAIEQFYDERGGLGPRIRVVTDVRSNAVIVQASPRDLAEIAALVRGIDVARARTVDEVRVFRLTNSLADDLAAVLQGAIAGQALALGGGGAAQAQQVPQGRSAMLTLQTLDTTSQQILRSGIFSDVRVTADVRANALVVTGPPENMELIGELIRQLDQLPSAEAQLKVFTIVNGDAVSLAQVLEDLFGQQTTGGGGFGQQLGADQPIIPLRISVDQRTNSIIVSGSGSDLEVVEAILLRLDESGIDERKNTVYRLNNAPAIDVSNAINEFLRSQRQVEQLAPEVSSPFEQIEREVIVVPEPVNNSLIISATPRYYEEILRLVEELDKRPPMVMIQVLIAEIALDGVDEMGIELGVQDSLLFDRSSLITSMTTGATNVLDPGFLFNNQPLGNSGEPASVATRGHFAPQVLSSFGVGRSNMGLGYGGLVISGGNDEVSVLVRALQDDRRLDVLSRPQVMTLDNQPAFVQVGQRVPRITSSNIAASGAVINNTVLENVGILLGVTPRISPEGLVVMEIDAERSRLGPEASGIPISVDTNGNVVRSPIIDTITAQTTVSALSGQTVILGGLITKNDRTVSRRVPHLSKIPIIGSLFRYDSVEDRRTELMFIMTPYIVRDEADVEMVKQMETKRMSWCLADVVSIHGDANLSGNGNSHVACWDDGATKVIYPDLAPLGPEPLELPPPESIGLPPLEMPIPPPPAGGNSILLRPEVSEAASLNAGGFAAPPMSQPISPIPPPLSQWQYAAPASYQGMPDRRGGRVQQP